MSKRARPTKTMIRLLATLYDHGPQHREPMNKSTLSAVLSHGWAEYVEGPGMLKTYVRIEPVRGALWCDGFDAAGGFDEARAQR